MCGAVLLTPIRALMTVHMVNITFTSDKPNHYINWAILDPELVEQELIQVFFFQWLDSPLGA
jgi:hemolysin-activating ACP:hemolysin acyltransferase